MLEIGGEPLNWRQILTDHPEAAKGMFNPDRSELLRAGVFVMLSPMTAASWMPTLRQKLETAGAVLSIGVGIKYTRGPAIRVTIIEVPEAARNSQEGGKILVEAEGVQEWISASIFSNCIKGQQEESVGIGTPEYYGWAPPDDIVGNVG